MRLPNRSLIVVTLAAVIALGISSASPASANGDAGNGDTSPGTLKGRVIDAETQAPLPKANVVILGTTQGDAADRNGVFVIPNVRFGSYVLQFSHIGYEPLARADVIVRPSRITTVDAELRPTSLLVEGIDVHAGYFQTAPGQPTSTSNFSHEEIRRMAGSANDVSRIVGGLPGVSQVHDFTNALVVRGGSPMENAFFIDNIEVPNINHFPTQGSSGGPIGLVNVDFIEDVDFYAGGFGPAYGDRLSSIMNLHFREGNRDEFDGQLSANFAGFGLTLEAPIAAGRGSWLLSANRSYLDLLVDAVGVGVAPRYSDYQGKLAYDINPYHRLTIIGLTGIDHYNMSQTEAVDNDMSFYNGVAITEGTGGVNWRALWNSGYSNTSVAYTATHYDSDTYETKSEMLLLDNLSREETYKLRNVNHLRLSSAHQLEFGAEAKHLITDHDNFYAEYTDPLGNTVPEMRVDELDRSNKLGAYVSHIWRPRERWTANLGARADYFSYNDRWNVSPRLSLSYRLGDHTTLSGAAGIYHQNLPLILLLQADENTELADPISHHYVIGLNHLLADDLQLKIEAYHKDYRDFPLDPTQPDLFVLDELYYRYGIFFNHASLVDNGKAYSRGIDFTLRKKLSGKVYGLVGGSLFTSRYRDVNGTWRDRIFDNRALFTLEGGYKLNRRWEFSARWVFAGGQPFTPFDAEASSAINRGVFDAARINGDRMPANHSLNIRLDRRYIFKHSNLVTFASIWNAYNRKNVSLYYWNENENREDEFNGWTLLPVLGMEYEF